MTPYKPVWHAKGAQEAKGLLGRPGQALFEVLTAIIRDPWGTTNEDQFEGDPTFRWAPFDQGLGAVHVRVDDQAHTVTIHGVSWIG